MADNLSKGSDTDAEYRSYLDKNSNDSDTDYDMFADPPAKDQ